MFEAAVDITRIDHKGYFPPSLDHRFGGDDDDRRSRPPVVT